MSSIRRAIAWFGIVAVAAVFASAPAQAAQPMVNAIGLIDYSHKPNFKPGDWVKYRVSGASSKGDLTDYTVTVIIGGEERFWGEDCFWIETHTQPVGSEARSGVATLMSYDIFGDSLAIVRMKLYMRKTVTEVNEQGEPIQQLLKQPPLSLKNRQRPSEHIAWDIDTVGVDTVNVPTGVYKAKKVRMEEGVAATSDRGDSTIRTEVRDIRHIYYAPDVPITRVVREHIENNTKRKAWPIGRSGEGTELLLISRAEGDARLLEWGHGGIEAELVPKKFRKTIQEQLKPVSSGKTKSSTAKKSG